MLVFIKLQFFLFRQGGTWPVGNTGFGGTTGKFGRSDRKSAGESESAFARSTRAIGDGERDLVLAGSAGRFRGN